MMSRRRYARKLRKARRRRDRKMLIRTGCVYAIFRGIR